jgi:hypothetical protein
VVADQAAAGPEWVAADLAEECRMAEGAVLVVTGVHYLKKLHSGKNLPLQ